MHEHGPDCLEGPIRGSSAWWRGLAPETTRKKTSKTEEKDIRQELVARIRREIAAGTYDTPEKWEAALNRLWDRMSDD